MSEAQWFEQFGSKIAIDYQSAPQTEPVRSGADNDSVPARNGNGSDNGNGKIIDMYADDDEPRGPEKKLGLRFPGSAPGGGAPASLSELLAPTAETKRAVKSVLFDRVESRTSPRWRRHCLLVVSGLDSRFRFARSQSPKAPSPDAELPYESTTNETNHPRHHHRRSPDLPDGGAYGDLQSGRRTASRARRSPNRRHGRRCNPRQGGARHRLRPLGERRQTKPGRSRRPVGVRCDGVSRRSGCRRPSADRASSLVGSTSM